MLLGLGGKRRIMSLFSSYFRSILEFFALLCCACIFIDVESRELPPRPPPLSKRAKSTFGAGDHHANIDWKNVLLGFSCFCFPPPPAAAALLRI
ncbi:hypothetical protein V6N11_000191 [Hibiscus sabdariffa]|uniref:Uncharacterized protein n=2 Tax=Hibiscus sabdariffa TaxID=183260 RepID=A0ABR2B5Y5_9ROSI